MRDLLREAQKIDDLVGSGNRAGSRRRRDRNGMAAFLDGLDPKDEMTELVLGMFYLDKDQLLFTI